MFFALKIILKSAVSFFTLASTALLTSHAEKRANEILDRAKTAVLAIARHAIDIIPALSFRISAN